MIRCRRRRGTLRRRVGDAASRFLGPLDGIGVALGALALRASFDDEGVRIGELDVHVLLIDAGQFALEFVGVFDFADVEFGLEGADGGGAAGAGAGAVDVVVVEEAEEGGEVGCVVGKAWEQRHCADGLWVTDEFVAFW